MIYVKRSYFFFNPHAFFSHEIGNKDDDKKDDERENDLDGEAHFRDNLRDAQLLSDLSAENDPGNSLQKALVLSPSKVGKGILICDRGFLFFHNND